MKRLSKEAAAKTNRFVRKVAIIVDQNVVLATPVDTGRARSNWIVSVSSPETNEIDPYQPGEQLGVGESGNAQSAINQALGQIAVRKNNQDIFIQNNVEYVKYLNEGSSKQAPANFVQLAIANAITTAKTLKFT